MMDGVMLLSENIESLRMLSAEELGTLMHAILADAEGEEPDTSNFSFAVSLLYPIILGSVRRMRQRSAVKSAAGRAGSEKRWSVDSSANSSANSLANNPSQTKPSQTKPNQTNEWVSPTAQEVAEYASKEGLRINAKRFVDYYAARGWMTGSTPVTDWQALARSWAAKDAEKGGFNFNQRGTDYDALLGGG